ncbi:hypothetical protein J2S43_002125 [Catenuloplanes nepalensis]|uniref:ABC transporter permease n=1 Tax=Catenuloplanes nepalensis TaxID=587533 RepID=A0ABT9MQB4_9ACTN|nr:hypothetical protein [Catenuloplanes nepalensis]MDP9793613.1 hypothetical protein [Catenuloplanes nepalensis]
MRPLLLHLRISPLRWVVVPLIALDIAVLLLRSRFWIGIWPETGAAAQVPAYFLSIIAAGAAAWAAGAKARNNLEEQLAAGAASAPKTDAHRLAATAVLLMIPYLAGQAVAFGYTVRAAPPGLALWSGYLLMGVVVMLLATAWGWAIGRYLSAAYAALVALLSWIIILFYLAQGAGLSVTSGPPWVDVDLRAVSLRLAAALLLIVAVIWLPGRHTPARARWAGLVPAGAAVTVLAVIGVTPVLADRPVPPDLHCVDGPVEMCLWPEHALYEPIVRQVSDRVGTLPADFVLPARLNEYGIDRFAYEEGGETAVQLEGGFDISEGSKWSVALGVADSVVAHTLRTCDRQAIAQAEDYSSEALARWLEGYLAGEGTRDYRTSAVPTEIQEAWTLAAEVSQRPASAQLDWARQQVGALKDRYCG